MLKPWTWEEIAEKSKGPIGCDAFVATYSKIGAVALELANRLKNPSDGKPASLSCGCAMCKQWHYKWSDERLRKYYKKLYFAQYYGKNLKP